MGTTEANAETTADAIVVGAGPAGSVTALLLARRGVDVLLLDRASFPRPKPCGDCLSAAATGLLDRLDLLRAVLEAGAATVEGWRIVAPDGTVAGADFPAARGLALERRHLDSVLHGAAIDAGARFRRAHVTDLVTADGRVAGVRARAGQGPAVTLRAPLVVGADGLRSVIARRLDRVRRRPRIRKVSLTAHLPVAVAPSRGEMHVIEDGCVGFAPAGNGLCNLTVVVDAGAGPELSELGPARVFRNRVARTSGLEERVEALRDLRDDDLLASGPFDWPSRGPVGNGAALVGDAAGYYDPFTGQGIFQAMASAEILAGAVAPVLLRADPSVDGVVARDLDRALRRYELRKRRMTRSTRRIQWVVEQVVSRPSIANRALHRLADAPTAMQCLIEVTGDLRPPRSLLSPAVVSSFLIPPSWRPA